MKYEAIVSISWKSLYLERWSLYRDRVLFLMLTYGIHSWLLGVTVNVFQWKIPKMHVSFKHHLQLYQYQCFIPYHYHLWWDDGLGSQMCWCVFCMTGIIILASSSCGEGCWAEIVSTIWVTVASVAMVVTCYSLWCLTWKSISKSDLW